MRIDVLPTPWRPIHLLVCAADLVDRSTRVIQGSILPSPHEVVVRVRLLVVRAM